MFLSTTGAFHLKFFVSKSLILMGVIAGSAVLMNGQAGNSASPVMYTTRPVQQFLVLRSQL